QVGKARDRLPAAGRTTPFRRTHRARARPVPRRRAHHILIGDTHMEIVKTLLEQQPLAALFAVIALGYLAGQINIKGFSLGVGAVLFVGRAVGWFAPKAMPAAMVGTLGLALFLYAVGIQYGGQFFSGLKSPEGRKANLLALTGVLLSAALSLLLVGGQ